MRTDHGQRHDPRGLKHRDPDAIRIVPIPPWLVHSLRHHKQADAINRRIEQAMSGDLAAEIEMER